MNKTLKIILSILGATNIIMDIFIPLAIVLLLIISVDMNWYSEAILILASCFSSIYKSIEVFGIYNIDSFLNKNKN